MTTPAPAPAQLQGEPFSEALSEAAQAAAMSVRLILTIVNAVRRASQKRHEGEERELGEEAQKLAPGWSADQLRQVLPQDILGDLVASTDWPVMARHLVGLEQAGVDLSTFLPQMGRMAAGVQQAVADNITRTKAEGTDRWADLLRTTMPEGVVRNAILASPAWPDIAATMGRLDDKGVDVARILTDAHAAGLGVDQAVAAVTTAAAAPATAPAPTSTPGKAPTPATAPAAGAAPASTSGQGPTRVPGPTPAKGTTPAAPAAGTAPEPADPWASPVSTDAKRSWGPLTEGLDLPRDLDLGDRTRALRQLKITPAAHSRIVSMLKTALPQHEAGLLVTSRQWPLLAARIQRMTMDGAPLDAHLARLQPADAAWRQGPPAQTTGRLLLATHHALTTPPGEPLPTKPHVSPTAAKSRSTTAPNAPTGRQAPAEPATPAHRRQTTPTKSTSRHKA